MNENILQQKEIEIEFVNETKQRKKLVHFQSCVLCIHLTFGTLTIDHNQKKCCRHSFNGKKCEIQSKKKRIQAYGQFIILEIKDKQYVCVCIDGIF